MRGAEVTRLFRGSCPRRGWAAGGFRRRGGRGVRSPRARASFRSACCERGGRVVRLVRATCKGCLPAACRQARNVVRTAPEARACGGAGDPGGRRRADLTLFSSMKTPRASRTGRNQSSRLSRLWLDHERAGAILSRTGCPRTRGRRLCRTGSSRPRSS